jgi:N-dimethylarginine dimethylaminohydrolase
MCRPDHYDVVYEINPWMSVERTPDTSRAWDQWHALHDALSQLPGVAVELIPQVRGCPDMVFTANAGLVRGAKAVLARFRHPERGVEEPHYRSWLEGQGLEVVEPPLGMSFEGEGDALFAGGALVTGYYQRSDARSSAFLTDELGCLTLSLCLVDARWYHLDTCFLPLGGGVVAYYPGAMDGYAERVIERNFEAIRVPEDDAARFACNAVVIDRHVVMPAGCDETAATLEGRGYSVVCVDTSEFIKAGGSCKCLTLHLDHPPMA